MNFSELHDFYDNHLKEVLLPFWLNKGIDSEFGGFFTCFDTLGEKLVSTDKYTWSQGRLAWLFSKLSEMTIFNESERQNFLALAESTAEFLMKHSLLPNGNCTFVMERNGNPKADPESGEYDTSIYADCFVILGLSKYAAVSGRKYALDFAVKLYSSTIKRFESNSFKTEPYPIPQGYKTHGIPMIKLNISWELCRAMELMGFESAGEVDRIATEAMDEIMTTFVENGIIHEMVRIDGSFDNTSLMGRYINPGHIIEDMWFVMYQAIRLKNRDYIERAAEIIVKTFEAGWDDQFGGLLLFADKDGGKPKGITEGQEKDKMVLKVLNDWDNKLWWPHSEALYSTLLAYSLTRNEQLLSLYKKTHDYTFKTFPNPNRETGEWIQIRDRNGNPQQKVVALPVKDPFHIIRNVLQIIDLMEEIEDY